MRKKFDQMAKQFVDEASHANGLKEIAILGEMATGDPSPYGLELAVIMSDFEDFEIVALAARRLTTISNRWLAYVFSENGEFLGNICFRKKCRCSTLDNQHPKCGEIKNVMWNPDFHYQREKMFSKPLKVIFSQANSLFETWQKAVLNELELDAPVEKEILQEITLTCCDCGAEFPWTVESQKFFTANGWTPPKRCPGCRPAKCLRCGMRLPMTVAEAEKEDIELCEACLEEIEELGK